MRTAMGRSAGPESPPEPQPRAGRRRLTTRRRGGLTDFISQFIPPIPEAGGTTTTDWVTNMLANAGPRAQPATVVDNSVHLRVGVVAGRHALRVVRSADPVAVDAAVPCRAVLLDDRGGRVDGCLRVAHRDHGGHEHVNHPVFQSLAGCRGRMALMSTTLQDRIAGSQAAQRHWRVGEVSDRRGADTLSGIPCRGFCGFGCSLSFAV